VVADAPGKHARRCPRRAFPYLHRKSRAFIALLRGRNSAVTALPLDPYASLRGVKWCQVAASAAAVKYDTPGPQRRPTRACGASILASGAAGSGGGSGSGRGSGARPVTFVANLHINVLQFAQAVMHDFLDEQTKTICTATGMRV